MNNLSAEYDRIMMAICIWREARGEPEIAKRGVAHVLLNRVTDPRKRWPSTPAAVVLQLRQFSSFNSGDPNATKFPLPDDHAWLVCCEIVADPGSDPADGANHYHSYADPLMYPKWADPHHMTAILGALKFYKL